MKGIEEELTILEQDIATYQDLEDKDKLKVCESLRSRVADIDQKTKTLKEQIDKIDTCDTELYIQDTSDMDETTVEGLIKIYQNMCNEMRKQKNKELEVRYVHDPE